MRRESRTTRFLCHVGFVRRLKNIFSRNDYWTVFYDKVTDCLRVHSHSCITASEKNISSQNCFSIDYPERFKYHICHNRVW